MMLMKRLKILLKKILGKRIVSIYIDNNEVNYMNIDVCKFRTLQINFQNDKSLLIKAADIPHFYGEGDLLIKEVKSRISLRSNTDEIVVNEVKVWGYKPKGINLFSIKNIVQLELIESEGRKISIGFFKLDGKHEFLSTEELAFNLNKEVSKNISKRLSIIFSLN